MAGSLRTMVAILAIGISLGGARAYGADTVQDPDSDDGQRPVKVVIYPILVQAPIFGATIDLPGLPDSGDGSAISGSTDVALNAAYMAGISIETNRVFVEVNGTWAALSATREAPRVSVKSDTLLFAGRAGVRLFKGVSATAGVRRVVADITATLTLPRIGTTLEGRTKPGLWDPLIGVDWRGHHGVWDIAVAFQGGGFGVGSDVAMSADVRADLRFLRHLALRMGYQFLYYKLTVADVSIGPIRREFVSSQTLHGPSIGLGIVF